MEKINFIHNMTNVTEQRSHENVFSISNYSKVIRYILLPHRHSEYSGSILSVSCVS